MKKAPPQEGDLLEYAILVALVVVITIIAIMTTGGFANFFKEIAEGLASL